VQKGRIELGGLE
ncbi:hypothetical protein A2U01_0072327, partial [Trifolium medium]|nr:hypothetical protein [Trifolium medium]